MARCFSDSEIWYKGEARGKEGIKEKTRVDVFTRIKYFLTGLVVSARDISIGTLLSAHPASTIEFR